MSPRKKHPRALTHEEHARILAVLHEDRFVDKAPSEVYAKLLDEGIYLSSISTMYRILRKNDEVLERRNILRHPEYKKPELQATGPNQVWSWDITKIRGPEKWTYYYLYVVLDIYSRYVVGWMIADKENASLAKVLITDTCARERVRKNQLIIHSDRGAPMTAKLFVQLLADLGVTKSESRPRTSDDNPYSESNFKTLKYRPTFPKNFGSIQDARAFLHDFFDWYNFDHYHSGIALMTPHMVHTGRAVECNTQRQAVLSKAYLSHPERFVNGAPITIGLPEAAWINQPEPKSATKPEPGTVGSACATMGGAATLTTVR